MTAFRAVAITLLMGALVVRLLTAPSSQEPSLQDSLTFVAIGAVYVLTLIYSIWLRHRDPGRAAAWLQVAADVLVATGLVYITGGADSPYTFTYLLAVVAGSILLYQRGAIVAAVSSAVLFISLSLAIHTDLIPAPAATVKLQVPRLAFALVSNLLAQVFIAVLATYLARQLWTTGGRLSAREADLRKLGDLQNKILGSMPSGLITCDGNGAITFVNRAARSILGLPDALPPTLNVDVLMPGTRTPPIGRRREVVATTPVGERILGLTATSLSGGKDELLVVFQDLTDLRRAQEELSRADRLAALGKLSAQLAHEIRNPLAAMRGSAQLLAGDTALDASSARLANILVREADRLSVLVDEFLRFARPPPPSLQECDVSQIVRETVDMLMSDPLSQGISVTTQLAPVVAAVDASQLRQVVINLLRNAFSAAASGGEVRVRVDGLRDALVVRVWDSAGSIEPANVTRIFEPFFTTRAGGTGLGLSTAHSIVRAHGGTIEVNSSKERGTEFVVNLPRAEAARANTGG